MLLVGTREFAQSVRKRGQLFNGAQYWRNDFFQSSDDDVCAPQCYLVEQFPDYTQVLSLGMPMVDRLWGPDQSPDMAKLANDGLAEVVEGDAGREEPGRRGHDVTAGEGRAGRVDLVLGVGE